MNKEYNFIMSMNGSKLRYLDKMLPIINNSKAKIYVEPFLGTSCIYLNVKDNFEQYILNDLNIDMLWYYKFYDINFKEEYEKLITEEFKSKFDRTPKGLNNWREFKNKTLVNAEPKDRMIYSYFAISKCIKGFVKWTGDNYNSPYNGLAISDDRYRYYPDKVQQGLKIIKERRSKTKVYNNTYKFILNMIPNSPDYLVILDPPYKNSSWSTAESSISETIFNFCKEKDKVKVYYMDYEYPEIWRFRELGFTFSRVKSSNNTMNNSEIFLTNF